MIICCFRGKADDLVVGYFQSQYLIHFGIKGQKHGVRRFQNEDGSLTEEGKLRYLKNYDSKSGVAYYSREAGKIYDKVTDELNKDLIPINKKWEKIRPQGFEGTDSDSTRAYIEYVKEVNNAYKKRYRDVIAKDIGSDPSTLAGQKWLNDLLYYNLYDDIIEYEEKSLSEKKR